MCTYFEIILEATVVFPVVQFGGIKAKTPSLDSSCIFQDDGDGRGNLEKRQRECVWVWIPCRVIGFVPINSIKQHSVA